MEKKKIQVISISALASAIGSFFGTMSGANSMLVITLVGMFFGALAGATLYGLVK